MRPDPYDKAHNAVQTALEVAHDELFAVLYDFNSLVRAGNALVPGWGLVRAEAGQPVTPEFQPWPKIARLNRTMTITEKIDGTNACVIVTDDGGVFAQSRKRLITPEDDNQGFARWVRDYGDELIELGPGHHFGEWWGAGIQRRYDQVEKRFSLFNTDRWGEDRPSCCDVVPVLYQGPFDTDLVDIHVARLWRDGSAAAPGFKHPEGVVVFHHASRHLYKVTCQDDEQAKAEVVALRQPNVGQQQLLEAVAA